MALELRCSEIQSQFKGTMGYAKAALVGHRVYLNYSNYATKSDSYALARLQRRQNTNWGAWESVAEDFGQDTLLAPGFSLTLVDEELLSIGFGFARKIGGGEVNKRRGHVYGPARSYIFNLTEEGEDALAESWNLDISVNGVKEPFRISYHSADYLHSQILIFGGNRARTQNGEFDFKLSNSLFGLKLGEDPSRVYEISTKGTAPSARVEHQSCTVGMRYLYVYGGLNSLNGHVLSDVHRLDLMTSNWSTISGSRSSSARYAGGMCYFSRDKSIYVFGGKKQVDERYVSNSTCERIKVTDSGRLQTVNITGDQLPGGEMCLATEVFGESMLLVSIGADTVGVNTERRPKLHNISVVSS